MELQIIQSKIYGIRGQKVMLDFDLAGLYQVETRVLNQAVKRNSKQFPTDLMFQLNTEEWEILKSQIVISSWGGTRKLPFAFTEQGLAMLSGVLNSDRHRSEYFHYASFCSCPPSGLGDPVSYTNEDSTRITTWLQDNWDKTIGN